VSIKAVIFDVDGTLVDNVSLCVEAYQYLLERHVGRPFLDQEVKSHFGKSDEGILGVYLPPDRLAQVLDEYYSNYETIHRQRARVFTGIKTLLQHLKERGIAAGVVTGKSRRGTEITLQVMGLESYMDVVESGFAEGANKPESLRRVLSKLGLEVSEAVYVGDTSYDIEAAASIGMRAVGAAWGATHTISSEAAEKAARVFYRIEEFDLWLAQETADQVEL